MIGRLSGQVAERSAHGAIIDCGGVGYLVHASLATLAALPAGGSVTLRVITVVREDDISLYGFATEAEEQVFRLLRTVSGIGPKLAINILSGLPAAELAGAIIAGDLPRLVGIPGVGKRTAERLVVELKEKMAKLRLDGAVVGAPEGAPAGSVAAEVYAALEGLGYKGPHIERALKRVRESGGFDAGFDAAIRQALRVLSGA